MLAPGDGPWAVSAFRPPSQFRAGLAGAVRPPWTPGADPREQGLAAAGQFLLGAAVLPTDGQVKEGWS